MINRFENFTITVLKLNKLIQKIKICEMRGYGLKAVHVMCIYYLDMNRNGLTASELAKLTLEDKAAISRALNLLREKGFVSYGSNKYNERVRLTETGEKASAYILEKADSAVNAAGGSVPDCEREIMYRSLGIIADNLEAYYQSLAGSNR